MEAARRGKLDAVLVWKLDRFGRSALDVLSNIRALESAGVRFVAVTQGIDIRPGSDAMSRLILGVLASVAEFEADLIRERTRLGMAKAREAGKRIGRPAVERPDRAEVERLRAQGKSWREVSEALRCRARCRLAAPPAPTLAVTPMRPQRRLAVARRAGPGGAWRSPRRRSRACVGGGDPAPPASAARVPYD